MALKAFITVAKRRHKTGTRPSAVPTHTIHLVDTKTITRHPRQSGPFPPETWHGQLRMSPISWDGLRIILTHLQTLPLRSLMAADAI